MLIAISCSLQDPLCAKKRVIVHKILEAAICKLGEIVENNTPVQVQQLEQDPREILSEIIDGMDFDGEIMVNSLSSETIKNKVVMNSSAW